MRLTSEIAAYDTRWPTQFDDEAARLRSVLGQSSLDIHHLGSTAVPALSAKPEIDILLVVPPACIETDWSVPLARFGYRRGGDLSPGHQFYKRDVSGIRTHKLHVCRADHEQVSRMLTFRDLLRSDGALCRRYEALKSRLEHSNTFGIGEYLAGKAPFIEAALRAP